MNLTTKAVADALNKLLKKHHLNVKDAADLAAIRPEHLSKYLRAKTNISFELGFSIASKIGHSDYFCTAFSAKIQNILMNDYYTYDE
jgi:plasmid maintenance system antidote protein VapI